MEMKLQMSLTLADAASGPLRAFTAQMEALKTATNTVGARLEAIAAGIGNVAKAASAASGVSALGGSLTGLSTAMAAVRGEAAGAATAIGQVGQRASAAGVGTYALEQAMGALGGTLQGVIARLAEVAASLAGISTEARAAGAGVRAGMASMEAGMASANVQANGLMTSLKGMAQIWGALKVEKFLGASITEGGAFGVEEAKVKALNLGAEKTQEILGKAWDDSKALGFASVLDTIRGRLAAIGGLAQTMDQSTINATLPAAMTLANNLKMLGEKGNFEDTVRNVYGFIEARGQTHDPAAVLNSFDLIQKAYTATGGKVTMRDLEMTLRRLGQGATQISDEGILNLVGVTDLMKISGGDAGGSGGGASQVGVAFKMLQAYGLGKAMNKQGAQLFAEAGILDPRAIIPSGDSTLSTNIRTGGFRDAALLASDPVAWVQRMVPIVMDYMARNPARFYQGADPNNPEAQAVALQKFITSTGISVTAAQALGIAAQPGTSTRLREQTEIAKNAKGVSGTKELLDDTLPQKLANAKAAFDNLYIVIGNQLLPVLTPLIQSFAEFLRNAAQFSKDHPMLTFFNIAALAVGGLVLAFNGVKNVFGIVGTLAGLLGGFAGTATAAGAAVEVGFFARLTGGFTLFPALGKLFGAFGTDVLAGISIIGKGFLRLLPLVGELILAWDFAELLVHLAGGGDRIMAWATGVADWITNKFKAAFASIGLGADAATKGLAAFGVKPGGTNDGYSNPAFAAHISGAGAGRGSINPAMADPNGPRPVGVPASWFGGAAAAAMNQSGAPGRVTVPGGGSGGGSSRFANFNPEADLAANEYKVEEDALRNNLRVMDALYKSGSVSIDNYYIGKQAALEVAVEAEMKTLNEERDAFLKAGNMAGVNRADTKIEQTQSRLDAETDRNAEDRKRAKIELDQRADTFKRQLILTEDQRHTAEAMHLQQETEATIKVLLLNGEISEQQAKDARDRTARNIELKKADYEFRTLQEGKKLQLQEIDSIEKQGLISETQATDLKIALRKQEAAAANEVLAKELALAELNGNDLKAAQIRTAMAQNTDTINAIAPDLTAILKGTQTGFANFFQSITSGTKSVSGAFKALGQSIFDTINNIVAKRLGDMLFDSLFGGLFGGKGAPFGAFGGGFGGGMGGGFGSLLGGLGGSASGWLSGLMAPTMVAGTTTTFASALAAGIIPLASGTDYVPRDMLALIHKGERVMPAADNAAFSSAMQGGMRPFSNTTNISVRGNVDRRTATQIARESAIEIQRGMRRNG